MSIFKSTSFKGAVIFTQLAFGGLSLHLANANENPSNEIQHKVEYQRPQDSACTQCHQEQQKNHSGFHASAINPKTKRPITCIDCHTRITKEHRNGASDVVKFTPAQSVSAQTKNDLKSRAASLGVIVQQNERCESCHSPDQLQEINWTHDVHARNLTCVSCHTVHPLKDPMKGITRKEKIKTCIDCHSNLLTTKEAPR